MRVRHSSFEGRLSTVLGGLLSAALLWSGSASAQTISGLTVTKNAGNSANSFQDGTFLSFERTTVVAISASSPTSFTTRYAEVVGTDAGALSGSNTITQATDYRVNFNVTSPAAYRLTVATNIAGAVTLVDDGAGSASGSVGAVSGGQTGGTLQSGGLGLSGTSSASGGGGANTVIARSNSAQVCAVSNGSPVAHQLTFTWSATCTTTDSVLLGGDECAVRLGIPISYGGETAGDYPGVGGRNQLTDGHFVNVTLTNLCGNGVIDSCGAYTEECDQGVANGTPGSCCTAQCTFKSSSEVCRPENGACDVAETCTGGSATCPANQVEPVGTSCRTPAGDCDEEEFCDGNSDQCPIDEVLPTGTLCRGSAVECDQPEFCAGGGSAGIDCPDDDPYPPGTPCGSGANTQCDNPDTCDGNFNCQANLEPPGFPCGSPANTTCTDPDTCDGAGTCLANHAPPSTECRGVAGVCDVAENCDGNGNCPADQFEPNTTLCRPDAGECDVPEYCLGGGSGAADCPADVFEPPATACGDPSDTVCDNPDSCDGSGGCLANNEPATTLCRGVAGDCDVAENCDGAGACPADGFAPNTQECRGAAGQCDVAENCTGSGPNCPPNTFALSGAPCGDPSDTECTDPDTCNGSGSCQSNHEPPGEPCGSPTDDDCTDPDTCDGSGSCLVNHAPDNTPCDDSNSCTTPDLCSAGMCIPGSSTQCLDHYKCYKAKDLKMPKFVRQTVNLSDQFGADNGVTVLKPAFVCNPVDKNGGGINNPVDHLTCYKIRGNAPFQNVQTTNQFGTLKLTARKSKLLCVPGSKIINP